MRTEWIVMITVSPHALCPVPKNMDYGSTAKGKYALHTTSELVTKYWWDTGVKFTNRAKKADP